MAIQIMLTNEQARWLSEHLDSLMEDWHWGRNRPSADIQEHVSTIKSKVDNQRRRNDDSAWSGPDFL